MSQQKKSQQLSSTPATNSIDKNRLDIQDIEKLSKEEQHALLQELQSELKAETSAEAAPLLEFVLKNISKIIFFIVVAIVAIAGWGIYQWRTESTFAEQQVKFQQILDIQDANERLGELGEFAQTAPEDFKIYLLIEEAGAATELQKYPVAIEKLKEAIHLDANSSLTISLNLALVDVYLMNNEAAKGLQLMEDYIKVAPKQIYSTILEEIAVLAEISGNTEKAIASYKELVEKTDIGSAEAVAYYKNRIAKLSK